jgi:hypothetical protein
MNTYALSIHSSLEKFRPEIEFVFKCLDYRFPLTRQTSAQRVLHYGPEPPHGAIALGSHLFPRAVVIGEHGVEVDRDALRAFALDSAQSDPVGLVFLLLSGIEERAPESPDRYGRMQFENTWLYQQGIYGTTPVDTALAQLASRLAPGVRARERSWPQLMPTHDVDRLRGFHRWHVPLREAAGDLVKRRSVNLARTRVQSYVSGEPWRSVRRLMALSERFQLQSRFYFMGPSDEPMDSPYCLRDKRLLARVGTEIRQRGHVVGFHPGFTTPANPRLWHQQRTGLERVMGEQVLEGRQHVLRYEAAVTPRIWGDEGMLLDLTPAYPQQAGFRTGSAHFLPAYCLQERRTLDVLRGSTSIMEFGMFGGKYRDLDIDSALAEVEPVIRAAVAVAGHCVLLFHSGHQEARLWRFYELLLDLASRVSAEAEMSSGELH